MEQDKVIVATVGQPMEATPIQVALASNGIDSSLEDEQTVAANPLLSNAVGGIKVVVAAADADRAGEILEGYRQAEAAGEAERARTCPHCGGTDGVPVRRPLLVGVLAVLTLGIFSLLYPWPKYRCPACRGKWR